MICPFVVNIVLLMVAGAGPTGIEEVKAHCFFDSVDWVKLFSRQIPPPFKPAVTTADDAYYFDTEFTSKTPRGETTLIFRVLTVVGSLEFPAEIGDIGFVGGSHWSQPHPRPTPPPPLPSYASNRILIFFCRLARCAPIGHST